MKSWIVRPTDPKTVGEIVRLAREEPSAIDEGRVFVGKRRARSARDPVKPGDEVRIGKKDRSVDAPSGRRPPQAADLRHVPILVQRGDLVAVAKPAGIPTVPDHHGASHALVTVVARALKKNPADVRITSRLDRDVSGVVVFALSDTAEKRLKEARARGGYARRYVALGAGNPDSSAGEWSTPIEGKESKTLFRVVTRVHAAAMLAVDPVTGRTHQIRIHASRAKLPLLGDPEYGGPRQVTLPNGRIVPLSRIALHAARVAVLDLVAEAPIPEELIRVWTDLGGASDAWKNALS